MPAATPPRKPNFTPTPSGLMDFEAVSLDSARAALDELPEGVEILLDASYWNKIRRAPLATDRALTGRAMSWLADLPENVQPKLLAERYPRVLNSIVGAWGDPNAREKVFEHLLNSRRRGRRGFPQDIEREISALCLYASCLPG